MTPSHYDMDILKHIKRIADSLEKIEKKMPGVKRTSNREDIINAKLEEQNRISSIILGMMDTANAMMMYKEADACEKILSAIRKEYCNEQ